MTASFLGGAIEDDDPAAAAIMIQIKIIILFLPFAPLRPGIPLGGPSWLPGSPASASPRLPEARTPSPADDLPRRYSRPSGNACASWPAAKTVRSGSPRHSAC